MTGSRPSNALFDLGDPGVLQYCLLQWWADLHPREFYEAIHQLPPHRPHQIMERSLFIFCWKIFYVSYPLCHTSLVL